MAMKSEQRAIVDAAYSEVSAQMADEDIKSGECVAADSPRTPLNLNKRYGGKHRSSIDVYVEEIIKARERGDADKIAEIAEIFYSRVQAEEQTKFEITDAFFESKTTLALHIGNFKLLVENPCWDNSTLALTDKDSDKEGKHQNKILWDTRIVEALGVPHSYLMGIVRGIKLAVKTVVASPEKLLATKFDEVYGGRISRFAEQAFDEVTFERNKKLKEIKEEISAARRELQRVENTIESKQKQALQKVTFKAIEKCCTAHTTDTYPPVPKHGSPKKVISKHFAGKSGIYIARRNDVVAYVGKSVDVGNRMSGHEKVFNEDLVSVIEMDASEISVAECWYIATLRPYRNSEMQTTEDGKEKLGKEGVEQEDA